METETTKVFEELAGQDYKYGFVTDVEQEIVPKGLNEDVVRLISAKKGEPDWLLEWRLEAFRGWQQMPVPAQSNSYVVMEEVKESFVVPLGRRP